MSKNCKTCADAAFDAIVCTETEGEADLCLNSLSTKSASVRGTWRLMFSAGTMCGFVWLQHWSRLRQLQSTET